MSTHTIDLADGDRVMITHQDGVIYLSVIQRHGDSAGVQIAAEYRDAIEAAWGEACDEQDVYRAQRAEQAAVWLEERGHRTVRDLVNAGHVDVEGVLAFAKRHDDAIARIRATSPFPPEPDPASVSAQCEDLEHQQCTGCACACHTPDDPCCADPECGRR